MKYRNNLQLQNEIYNLSANVHPDVYLPKFILGVVTRNVIRTDYVYK